MRRSLSVIAALSLLLASCGGTGSTGKTACTQQYWDGNLGVCLTSGWRPIDDQTLLDRGVPEEVLVAFQAQKTYSGQTPTITITKETLSRDISPVDYSDASIRSVTALPAYTQIDERAVTIDTHKLKIHVFSAQPISEEPARRFYQLSSTSKGIGYTVTALAPLSVPSALDTEIVTMMKSFTFVPPTGEETSSK